MNEQLRDYLEKFPTQEWKQKDYPIEKELTDRFAALTEEADVIVIIGDYDTDGICASKILTDGLRAVYPDKTISAMLPDRFRDGYGMNKKQIDRISTVLKQVEARGEAFEHPLIITCDNGITAGEVIEYAKEKIPNLSVIVTDHHLPKEDPLMKQEVSNFAEIATESDSLESREETTLSHFNLPKADLICNPHVGGFSYTDYCGAGVALKLIQTLPSEKLQELEEELTIYAGLATVADMVPMVEDNWCIARKSLELFAEKMEKRELPDALQQISDTLGLKDASQITSDLYGYQISPLLNAMGRLQDYGAQKVFRYLEQPTQDMKDILFLNNRRRKELTDEISAELLAKERIANHTGLSPIWVNIPAGKDGAEEGLCGLYAQKIAEACQAPAIVVTASRENPDILKGSGRSVDGFDLHAYLKEIASPYLLGFGGHAEACGLSCTMDGLRQLAKDPRLTETAPFYSPEEKKDSLLLVDTPENMIRDYEEMKRDYMPFGQDFACPDYAVELTRSRQTPFTMMGGGSHLSAKIGEHNQLKVLHFYHDPEGLSDPDHFFAIGHISENYYNGTVSYQLVAKTVVNELERETSLELEQEEPER